MRWPTLCMLVFAGCELDIGDVFDTDSDTGTDSAATLPYHYVLVEDLGDGDSTTESGADIDAFELVKETPTGGDGSTFVTTHPVEVSSYTPAGTGAGDMADALGPSDAYDVSNCWEADYSVSLGGIGGQLIVRFDEPIEATDLLKVFQVGDCVEVGGGEVDTDEIQVSVGVSADPYSPHWVVLTTGDSSQVALITIPVLPEVHPN